MNKIDLEQEIYTLLKTKPEARLNKNNKRVMWYIYTRQGAVNNDAITKEDFLKCYSNETITRVLREVKEKHGWQDPEAKEKEAAYNALYANERPEAHVLPPEEFKRRTAQDKGHTVDITTGIEIAKNAMKEYHNRAEWPQEKAVEQKDTITISQDLFNQ